MKFLIVTGLSGAGKTSVLRHLEDSLQRTHSIDDIHDKAIYFKDTILPAMEALRETCDQMERITAEEYWPYPTYNKLLFYV